MLKVLIVEDEDIIRKGLIHTIDWLSMGCIIAGDADNGLEGLRLIEEHRPGLVITDIKMPVMDGIEMLEKALTNNCFYSIILTSYSEFEYAKQAISLNVSEYLLKPVDKHKLADIIEKIKKDSDRKKVLNSLIDKAKISDDIELVNLDVFIFSDSEHNYYVDEALNQIKMNYNQRISIESISNNLGVSTSYLSRKFKDITDQTFLDVLNKYRVQKAIELLNEGKYRVYEVSELTGFSEYKHFCSVFKKYTLTSPTEFIKSRGCIIHKNILDKTHD
ncbi:MAG: AraC family transcriptional regulator [Clostridia bacterium BRH_c25]|nr:MAG: AraC family transcriptional regulator [Clostridia bacterium BRH_c25]